jgi:hypothetical protein
MREIGSLELHFNSRDARAGKIGAHWGERFSVGSAPVWRQARDEKV